MYCSGLLVDSALVMDLLHTFLLGNKIDKLYKKKNI